MASNRRLPPFLWGDLFKSQQKHFRLPNGTLFKPILPVTNQLFFRDNPGFNQPVLTKTNCLVKQKPDSCGIRLICFGTEIIQIIRTQARAIIYYTITSNRIDFNSERKKVTFLHSQNSYVYITAKALTGENSEATGFIGKLQPLLPFLLPLKDKYTNKKNP